MAKRGWDPRRAASMGAFYLDVVKPDWFRRIALKTLNLESEQHCVLGQCFRDYFQALEQLVPEFNGENWAIAERFANRRAFAVRFGFQVPESHQEKGGYERLGLAWKALIKMRRHRARRRGQKKAA